MKGWVDTILVVHSDFKACQQVFDLIDIRVVQLIRVFGVCNCDHNPANEFFHWNKFIWRWTIYKKEYYTNSTLISRIIKSWGAFICWGKMQTWKLARTKPCLISKFQVGRAKRLQLVFFWKGLVTQIDYWRLFLALHHRVKLDSSWQPRIFQTCATKLTFDFKAFCFLPSSHLPLSFTNIQTKSL